jgi:hypothetical protein
MRFPPNLHSFSNKNEVVRDGPQVAVLENGGDIGLGIAFDAVT